MNGGGPAQASRRTARLTPATTSTTTGIAITPAPVAWALNHPPNSTESESRGGVAGGFGALGMR